MMKDSLRRQTALAAFLILSSCVSRRQHEPENDVPAPEVETEREVARIKETVKQTLNELAERHKAVRDWTGIHQRNGEFAQVFTFEWQNALKKLNGRSIVIVSEINDVFETPDGYRILCDYAPIHERIYRSGEDDDLPVLLGGPVVTFLLEVDETTVQHIVEVSNRTAPLYQMLALLNGLVYWL